MSRAVAVFLISLLVTPWILNPPRSFGQASGMQEPGLKLGFTGGVFADVNMTDAKAAAKVWSEGAWRDARAPKPAIRDVPKNFHTLGCAPRT